MGLFKKLELKKEYFESTKGYSKIEITNLRKRQGFNVDIKNIAGDIYVEGTLSSFPQKILISDCLAANDIRLGGITIYGFKNDNVINFLNQHFPKSRDHWRISDTEFLSYESFEHDISRCTIHYLKQK